MTKAKPIRSSVYKKMVFSFLLFVALFSFLNAIIGYVFSRSYEEQVHADSQVMLSRIGEQLDERVFQQANSLYADLITNTVLYPEIVSYLEGDPLNSVSYYRLYTSLRAAVARSPEVFDSVSLFSRSENSIVSSAIGIKWIDERKDEKYTEWVQTLLDSSERLFWKYTPSDSPESSKTADISMYATYPSSASGKDCSGAVLVRLNLDTINSVLQEFRTEQSTYFIVDRSGSKVVGTGISTNFNELLGVDLAAAGEESRVSVAEVNGKKTVVISQPYQQDYVLVGLTSLSSFYEKTNALRNKIFFIGFAVVLIGLLLAAILSNRLYRPLRQLVEPARKKYGTTAAVENDGDEYAYIRTLMDSLSSKATSMEEVLEQNTPLIRNGLLQSLLQDTALDEKTLHEKMNLIGLVLPYPRFCVVHLRVPASAFEKMSSEQKELILYGLLNGYNEYHHNEVQLYGVRSAPDALSLIVNLTVPAMVNCDGWIRELREFCTRYCGIEPQICLSNCVESLLDIAEANRQSTQLEPYFYFLTDKEYLTKEHIPALQSGESETISPRILENFMNHMEQYQNEEAQKDIAGLVECCKTGKYSAQHCNQRILSLLFTFSRFVRNTHMAENDPFYEKIHADFNHCGNVDEFQQWMGDLVTHYLQLVAQNASGNYSAMMNEIMEYISVHLAEPISLDLLADTFRLSSNYLSRLFKEETGVNYTDFVNNAKLARAADQLEHTAKKIDEIAEENGFNSSAYFIKKFKQKYGVTPKKYRMDAVIEGQTKPE